ncbi:MAG TPA: nuclear transport factor 2 family protein [Gemmatimonadaceae bacterium]|nr:nuclear transport factor 2 family protein [Gemmatimonadaceae bacterium]
MASGRWSERWIADDFVITGADGILLSNAKAPILEHIRSGAWRVESVSVDNIDVRVFGETAVVTATQTERSQFLGTDSGGRFQYTHVWAKRRGRWQVVAAHVTRLR